MLPFARIRYVDACDDATEAEEKLISLLDRAQADAEKTELLRMERSGLLQTAEGLRTERDNAQWRVASLEDELWGDKDLKLAAAAVTARLAMEATQNQE